AAAPGDGRPASPGAAAPGATPPGAPAPADPGARAAAGPATAAGGGKSDAPGKGGKFGKSGKAGAGGGGEAPGRGGWLRGRRAAIAWTAVALVFLAAAAVVLARWFRATSVGAEFIATYPGSYPLPEGAPEGFSPWLGWQHFFNFFLMALIIKSGLWLRYRRGEGGWFQPRWKSSGSMPLMGFLHAAVDLLWVVNGVVFVVLLFATGQWMKIVPTSWEAIPNAVSAGIQYVSLDWPTENSWVHYNALQELSYFAVTFIAAPLAIISGLRLSELWPAGDTLVNRAFTTRRATILHVATMVFFVVFIVIHVGLVLTTGLKRNMNHIFLATDGEGIGGVLVFLAAVAVTAAAVIAARPFVVALPASRLGRVTSRP
ncbi:hypothetical protein AAV33_08420, partial [Corynebacterium otitidis]